MNFARVSALLAIIAVAVSAWIIATPASSVFPEATNHAVDIDTLFKFMLVASVPIFLIVQGYIVYFALKYRTRKGDNPNALGADIHGNTRLEIVWSIIPAVFLVVLTVWSYKVYDQILAGGTNQYVIDVTARQWSWECDHPQYHIQELTGCHMPLDRNVTITLNSPDVIHSFWVPEFRVKQDAVPGYQTRMHFKTTRVGIYRLICAEFCGTAHSEMYTKLYVCETDPVKAANSTACDHKTFDEWAKAQQQAASGSGNLSNLSFKKDIEPLFAGHCQACHISQQFGGLSLASYAGLQKGGNVVPGAVDKPGDHLHSVIWEITKPASPWPGYSRMPLGGPYLQPAEIAKIAAWIDQGAKDN